MAYDITNNVAESFVCQFAINSINIMISGTVILPVVLCCVKLGLSY